MEGRQKIKTPATSSISSLLVLVTCLILNGCRDSLDDVELNAKSFGSKDLRKIEQEGNLTLPTGSRGLNMYYGSQQTGPAFIAKVEIPAASAEKVIRQIEPIREKNGYFTNFNIPLAAKVKWWDPAKANIQIEGCFARGHSRDFVQLILCVENEQWVLYEYWSPY